VSDREKSAEHKLLILQIICDSFGFRENGLFAAAKSPAYGSTSNALAEKERHPGKCAGSHPSVFPHERSGFQHGMPAAFSKIFLRASTITAASISTVIFGVRIGMFSI
jgi:hypothetical protein